MNKKRLVIEVVLLSLVILLLISLLNLNRIKKQIAHYYYQQAGQSLEKLDNQRSTEYFIKAINWDPELNSQEYQYFKQHRQELLSDQNNKEIFFSL